MTPACGLRCPYCQPEGPRPGAARDLLAPTEIEVAVRALSHLGVRRVRLTGGEPLDRPECVEIVRRVAALPGIHEVSLTTNGRRLARDATRLARAGLSRVNVHLDTLRPERYRRLTGRDDLHRVLEGIVAARAAGLTPVKLNVVLMRGINDDELEDLLAFARIEGIVPRFIEILRTRDDGAFAARHFLSTDEARQRIATRHRLVRRLPEPGRGPAVDDLIDGGPERVGFISATTHPFCEDCNRLRLTARGELKACLFGAPSLDLRPYLSDTSSPPADLASALAEVLRTKRSAHPALAAGRATSFSMAEVGG